MSLDLYQQTILEELKNPQNKGVIESADCTIHQTNASCGDDITVFINFDKTKEKITEVSWTGNGCAISQSAMSFLSEKLLGMQVAAVKELTQSDVEELLGLEEPISYGRVKCLMLGLSAVQKAVS